MFGVETDIDPGTIGVYGAAEAQGWAGYFNGRVNVTGTLTKGGGAFKIASVQARGEVKPSEVTGW